MMLARPHQIARVFCDQRRRRIGLFGGSFNPAHDGHALLADMAVQQLRLDELWWLVSPQNPLKSSKDMASLTDRFESALKQAHACQFAKRMRISNLENQFGLQHSVLTVKRIKRHCRKARLIWVMGADNLVHFHRWHRPDAIPQTMAMAVINRPGHVASALASRGAKRAGDRITPARLAARGYPARHWSFLRGAMNPQSASAIRAARKTQVKTS
jgi:nicotinate-nucleotide adenylyltransferase